MNGERLMAAALACGAEAAALVSRDDIVLSREFYEMCRQNSCGNYGRCWMCPPDIGAPEALMAMVRGYRRGLLYQSVSALEDSFDIEGMTAAARQHARLSQRIQAALRPLIAGDMLHLSCGGCNLCESCTKPAGEPCRFPDRALMPMEGACIDVYNTACAAGLKYINGVNTVTYFGLVLFLGDDNA